MENKRTLSIKGLIGNYLGLPRSIYILFIARIINRFGGFVHAFLALFLSMYLDMTTSQIGTYVLYAGLAGFAGSYIGGKLGDRFSRKKVYLTAQTIAAILFVPCAFFVKDGLEYIPWLLIISSFFSAVVRPVNTAMVTDLVDKDDRKRAFSLLYLGINIGVAVGPMVAAILLKDYLIWFFLGDAITTFIAVILVAVFVEEKRITQEEMDAIEEGDSEAKEEGNILLAFLKRPILIIFVVFSVITAMMYAQVGFAFPLLMKSIYGGDNGPIFYAQLTMFNAVVVILLTSLTHYITHNLKPIYNIAMASILYALGMGMLAIVDVKWLFFVSTFIWTIGEIQAVTNQNVYLMGHTPINYRSRFLAIISIITSGGYILSPKIGGIVIDKLGQSALWTIVSIGGIIAAVGFMLIGRYESSQNADEIATNN